MHIHFIGIGGIGVSALAKYYMSRGAVVSGSDLIFSEITDELAGLGAAVMIGKPLRKNVPREATRVIYTSAIEPSHQEFKEAKRRKLTVQSYPEAIGALTKEYATIAVSGAHGKSTTTALTGLILEGGYCDPTVIVGTKVKEFGNSNFRRGFGPYLVLEADEWNKSFLHYSPKIAVVTNIDAEHLDTYKTVEKVEKAFTEYLAYVPHGGAIVTNADDRRLKKIAKKFGKRVHWYSLSDREAEKIRRIIRIPGEHNISNALAAWTVGRILGVNESEILHAISRFRGVWRRFEFKGIVNGAFVFSDYGHHPTEIRATITAARDRFPFRRVWCVYQPHQYQRLKYAWNDFVSAFDFADRISLLPVYDVAGRETKNTRHSVNSLKLAQELAYRGKNISHSSSQEEIEEVIRSQARQGDIILIMGAGDIYNLTNKF